MSYPKTFDYLPSDQRVGFTRYLLIAPSKAIGPTQADTVLDSCELALGA